MHGGRDREDKTNIAGTSIDIHNNDISESTDDGIELDFSEHNTRAYLNRITDVPLGISFQPCRGGPAYAVRNVLYNVSHETWKLHLTPVNPKGSWATGPHRTSGGVIIHNTVVKSNPPIRVWSQEGPVNYFYMRNNLYVGTGRNAIETTPPLNHLDSDYNLYANGAGKPFSPFAWIFRKTYSTIRDFAERTGCERHGIALASHAGIFAADVKVPDPKTKYDPPDLRLAAVQQLSQVHFQPVQLRTHGGSLSRIHILEPAQQGGNLPLAAQKRHADGFDLGFRPRSLDPFATLGPQAVDGILHVRVPSAR